MDWVSRRVRPVAGYREAFEIILELDGAGTCLSRALAAASLIPDSEVVIAVAPPEDSHLEAHAWVEKGGRRLSSNDVGVREIARWHFAEHSTRFEDRSSCGDHF
jgi:hypothetical protein